MTIKDRPDMLELYHGWEDDDDEDIPTTHYVVSIATNELATRCRAALGVAGQIAPVSIRETNTTIRGDDFYSLTVSCADRYWVARALWNDDCYDQMLAWLEWSESRKP